MHKFFYLLFLIIFTTQCSLDTKSGFWTKTEKIEKENKVIKIFESKKTIEKEFNPNLNIKINSIYTKKPFINNLNNNAGYINFESNFDKVTGTLQRIDAVVSRISGITTGKGENRYGKGRSPKDTASLKAKRRGVVFYPALQNDGSQVDYCYLKLKYNKREADVKLRDRVAGGNVTAAAATGRYRFILDNQDARGFKMKVKSLKEKRRKIRLRFCGSPSTRDVALSDCVTCELKQKKKK